MFDEYIHLLANGLDKNNENRIEIIHHKLLNSMQLKSASYDYDTYQNFSSKIKEAGLQYFIHVKSNVLETLQEFQQKLGITK